MWRILRDLQRVILVAAECMFMLRTYSIWRRSRQVLIILMGSLIAILVPTIYVLTSYNSSMMISEPPIPTITGCYNVTESRIIAVAYVLLVVGELEKILIFMFTIYRSIKHYRSLGSDNPLLKILIRHNIFYLACGLRE
ncbi:hypothetical protein K503DRAFT_750456 [Rhizopogon vinicolor AM-OR11-026]|uniref:Uncharacterized protein n=1 Tax=Rhizopogon vinicolor AM-OR11-026 TaxID=1314800 RepID=A0A1B7MGN5_9AGAM|nr:hypothetical protein K503DRAFT_750456 [Rhizopogon vinicolor AM-OR11-026]